MKWLATNILIILLSLTACSLLGNNDDESRPDIPGKIVFSAADNDGDSQIFTMNANGSDVRQLTALKDGHEASQPAWSPDGTQIVFSTSLQSSSNGLSLFLMDADGSNMRPMNEREGSHIPTPGFNPRWSPDGSRIAFDRCVNCQAGTNYEIFIYDLEADSVTQLTDFKPGVSNTNPSWSPDGSRIAFTSDRDYFNADTLRFRQDLYIIDLENSNVQQLTDTGNATKPVWSPTGNRIAYEWNIKGNEVFLCQLDSGEIRNIETGFEFSGNPLWNNQATQLLVFGRESDESQPSMNLIRIRNGLSEILHEIAPDIVGRNYDWYND